MYGLSQHDQLKEHGMACDMPPHSLIGYDLRPKKSPLQVILHSRFSTVGLEVLLMKKFIFSPEPIFSPTNASSRRLGQP
jgi:hypothetical protein